MKPSSTRYTKAYFDKWYRDPQHRVSTPTTTARKATMVLGVTEYYLERPVHTVLDVGCGEGQWRVALRRLRPKIRYTGVDPSPYVLQRFGKSRNILPGGLGSLPHEKLDSAYDLIICSDLLYYLSDQELKNGLKTLLSYLDGVAFLEAYGREEVDGGDTCTMGQRDATFYRKLFRRLGFVSCGPHCYAGEMLKGSVCTLEQ